MLDIQVFVNVFILSRLSGVTLALKMHAPVDRKGAREGRRILTIHFIRLRSFVAQVEQK